MNVIKHPVTVFLLGALTLYVVSGLFSGNWNPFKKTITARLAGGVPVVKMYPVANCGGRPCCKSGTAYGDANGNVVGCSDKQ